MCRPLYPRTLSISRAVLNVQEASGSNLEPVDEDIKMAVRVFT